MTALFERLDREALARPISAAKPPKPVYPTGRNAPLLRFLKRLLPDALVEKLIRRRYGLE